MPKPLVIVLPSADREALRNAGVLPPAWFRDAGAAGWGDGGTCIHIWTEELSRELDDESGAPPLPSRLIGLPDGARMTFETERLVAKFFGAVVLHVVFLDGEEGDGDAGGRPEKKPGWVGMGPVLETARWARAFNRSVEYWFSEEQARDIRHMALVVARGGRDNKSVVRVCVSPEQLGSLQEEFSPSGILRACYYVDGRLELENGNAPLHAGCLWPVLAGRLLLRFLIALSANADDDVFLPGVHLWRSFEALFDYPVGEMTDMVENALVEAYRRLSEETDAADSAAPPLLENEEFRTFPEMKTALTQFLQPPAMPAPSIGDWHRFDAVFEAGKREDDEQRWGGLLEMARTEFGAMETDLFRRGDPALACFSPDGVFGDIPKDPRNVALQRRRVEAGNPHPPENVAEVYRKWKGVIAAEKRRQAAKKTLRQAADELSLAQAHYVTAPWGVLVAGAVSLVCGYSIFRALWSLGGNGALPVALWFSGLSAAGAFAAWGVVSFLHRGAGREAADRFSNLACDVDNKMDARHAAAADTVRTAETRHRKMLRFDAWCALRRLLNRVWRILSRELQSPTLSAFYRTEDDGAAPVATDAAATEVRTQRNRFLELTQFKESLAEETFRPGRRGHSDEVLADALENRGERSFHALWHSLCNSADRHRRGNLPAEVLVPGIRRWLGDFCDRLSAAQKADLLEARGGKGILPSGFSKLRADAGFPLATAHVDIPQAAAYPARVFVFDETCGTDRGRPVRTIADEARTVLRGGGLREVPVTATPVLNGLPQVAFCFQDIRLFGLGREDDGRLKFLAQHEAAAIGKGGPR